MASCTQAFKRKPNWTSDETLLLLELIEEDKPVLLGARGSIPRSKKVAAWDNVAQAINAAFSSTHRTGKDCEKRYRSVKAQERPAISALKKQYTATGGGNPVGPPLTPVQEKLQDVLGPKHPTISGICRDADFEDEYYGEDVTVPAKNKKIAAWDEASTIKVMMRQYNGTGGGTSSSAHLTPAQEKLQDNLRPQHLTSSDLAGEGGFEDDDSGRVVITIPANVNSDNLMEEVTTETPKRRLKRQPALMSVEGLKEMSLETFHSLPADMKESIKGYLDMKCQLAKLKQYQRMER